MHSISQSIRNSFADGSVRTREAVTQQQGGYTGNTAQVQHRLVQLEARIQRLEAMINQQNQVIATLRHG